MSPEPCYTGGEFLEKQDCICLYKKEKWAKERHSGAIYTIESFRLPGLK